MNAFEFISGLGFWQWIGVLLLVEILAQMVILSVRAIAKGKDQ